MVKNSNWNLFKAMLRRWTSRNYRNTGTNQIIGKIKLLHGNLTGKKSEKNSITYQHWEKFKNQIIRFHSIFPI